MWTTIVRVIYIPLWSLSVSDNDRDDDSIVDQSHLHNGYKCQLTYGEMRILDDHVFLCNAKARIIIII